MQAIGRWFFNSAIPMDLLKIWFSNVDCNHSKTQGCNPWLQFSVAESVLIPVTAELHFGLCGVKY